MKFHRKILLILAFSALAGFIFYWISLKDPKAESLEQSSSAISPGSSVIELPPENQFRKANPLREIQSESSDESPMRKRTLPPSTHFKKNKPIYDLTQMELSPHELLEGTSWQIWTKMKPVAKEDIQSDMKIEINQYALIPSSNALIDLNSFNPQNPVPVFDSRNKIPGLISGTFVVTLRPEANPETLVSDPSIKVLQSFPEIHTYFVTSSEVPFSLSEFKSLLKSKGTVLNVETEVLNRRYAKN